MGKLIKRNFFIENEKVETVREYKYLGFLLTPSGEINTGVKDLRSRATYALTQLRSKMGNEFYMSFDVSSYLFKALVEPIILYLSDFWGCMLRPKNNHVDIVQNKFLKQFLGTQQRTTSNGILLETGQIPLITYAQKNCVKNWERIVENKCNALTKISYENALDNDLLWVKNIKTCLASREMNFESPGKNVYVSYLKKTTDIFNHGALNDIKRADSKLRTYALLKTEPGIEPYLSKIKNLKHRKCFSKFRLSNHPLMIEKGRHRNIMKELRFCPFCKNKVEDEIHFLLLCGSFAVHREILFSRLTEETRTLIFSLSDEEKFRILMTNPSIFLETAQFIDSTLQVRNFLLEQHKNIL